MASPFRFKNAALMMALAAAYPIQSYASAGTALFSTSDVTVRRGTATDPLTRGSNLESGDTILTGPAGRAQVRFSDGGLVSLQPNSQFNITRYVDANDTKQDAFLVDLLRGGMRAITGLIGKRNHDNYKVTTTTATIGIRGSAFLLSYLPDGTLVVSTEQDAIEVCTQAGCTGLAAGESARVINSNEPAVRTSVRATLPVPDPLRTPSIIGETVTLTGASSLVTKPPVTNIYTGMAFVSAGLKPNNTQTLTDQPAVSTSLYNPLDQRQYLNGTLVLNPSTGAPVTYQAQNNDQGNATGTSTIIASTGSYAANNLMILGTWSSDAWSMGSGGVGAGTAASSNLATGFVSGLPTASSALSGLKGMTGQYNLASATPVYATNGSVGNVTSGSLSVDFLGAGNYANLNLNVAMPALANVPVANSGSGSGPVVLPSNNTNFSLIGSGTGTGAGFSGALAVSSNDCINGTAACGTGTFNGFLGGPNAGGAGVSFTASGNAYGNFGGAATFSQTSVATTPASSITTGARAILLNTTGNLGEGVGIYNYSASNSGSSGGSGYGYFNNTTLQFTGNALVGATYSSGSTYNGSTTYSYGDSAAIASTAPLSYGSLGKVTDSDFIGWGVWAQGNSTNFSGSGANPSGSTSAAGYVHYIVGTPSLQMPTSGTATYGLVGGTSPTAVSGSGAVQTGQLLSASLGVNFSTSSANLTVNTQFGSTPVSISSTNMYTYGGNISSCNNNGVNVQGIFTGNSGYRAGLVYQASGTAVGTVSGAAAFQRTSVISPYFNP